MNEKIKWIDNLDFHFPIFHENMDNIIYQIDSERLVKIYKSHISESKKSQITMMVQYFLNHPNDKDIVPEKVWLSNEGFLGYEMRYEKNYQPLSTQLKLLNYHQIVELLYCVEQELLSHNHAYIYTDIDVDNILYNNGEMKWIDFDDCLITNTLTLEQKKMSLQHQRSIFNIFAISLLYQVSIEDIYYIDKTKKLSDEQKEQIRELLLNHYHSIDSLLKHYDSFMKQK